MNECFGYLIINLKWERLSSVGGWLNNQILAGTILECESLYPLPSLCFCPVAVGRFAVLICKTSNDMQQRLVENVSFILVNQP